jgi:hypothetical protein
MTYCHYVAYKTLDLRWVRGLNAGLFSLLMHDITDYSTHAPLYVTSRNGGDVGTASFTV